MLCGKWEGNVFGILGVHQNQIEPVTLSCGRIRSDACGERESWRVIPMVRLAKLWRKNSVFFFLRKWKSYSTYLVSIRK